MRPPIRFRASNSTTGRPAWLIRVAAARPAIPAPTMITGASGIFRGSDEPTIKMVAAGQIREPVASLHGTSELHHNRVPHAGFILAKIRTEAGTSRHTGESGCRGQEGPWSKRRRSYYRSCTWVRNGARGCIGAGGDAAATRPIRDISVAVAEFCTERDVLLRHPVEGDGTIPSFERVARILREVGCARNRVGSV